MNVHLAARIYVCIASLCSMPGVWASDAGQWQDAAAIVAAVRQHVAEQLAEREQLEITVGGIDERLKLPRCTKALDARSTRPLLQGRATVDVRCTAPAWRIYVPVEATFKVAVLVARRGLARGERLTDADLEVVLHGAQALPHGYLSTPDQARGRQLRRSVAQGAVLSSAVLDRDVLVARGQEVMLLAGAGGVLVKASGTALEPGTESQRIRVKTRSGRIIEGVVSEAGQIRIVH